MTDRTVVAFLKANVNDFNRGVLSAAATAKTFTKELDSSNDRMTNLVQSSLALGPALIPIGAAAVPAISGLTNQLAFAAAGAGVTALAFSGVGDALKAVNDYQLEPTTANFEKLQETMRELGPAGREFVLFLQEIHPQLQGLQDAAQGGLLPGAEDGIRELMVLMPQAERIVSQVAGAIGDLLAEGGDNLNDARWVEFFDFLETEARPTLLDMGRTLGNLAEGFANLWMAFDPLSDDFSASFLQMSRDFAAWTDGLDETEGFQEFIDYVTRVGPQAWDTLGALGNTLLQIVEAAAPVGEIALPVIEALADVLAAFADSPVGPVLLGAAAGISAISRAVALYNIANGSALSGLLTKVGGAGTGLRAGAAGIGILGLSLTDLDEKLGLTNTATFALAGIVAGPLGAAVGASAGLVLDLAAANDESAEAFNRASLAVMENTTSLQEQAAVIQAARDSSGGGGFQGEVDALVLSELERQYDDNARAAQDLRFEEAGLGDTMKNTSAITRALVDDTLDLVDAHNRAADQALNARDAERAYEAAIDDATATIKANGKAWNDTTEAGRANQAAVDGIAEKFNNLDHAGQQAKGGLEAARASMIRAAIDAGASAKEARKLASDLLKVKAPPPIKINVNTEAAMAKVRGLQQYINGMNGKTVRVSVEGGAPGGITRKAEGGYISGPGGPRDDVIPAMLSNGEYVVNAAATAANRGLLEAINNGARPQRFADGGYAQMLPLPQASSGPMVASLVGAEVSVGADGLMRFVRGVVRMDAQDDAIETRFAIT